TERRGVLVRHRDGGVALMPKAAIRRQVRLGWACDGVNSRLCRCFRRRDLLIEAIDENVEGLPGDFGFGDPERLDVARGIAGNAEHFELERRDRDFLPEGIASSPSRVGVGMARLRDATLRSATADCQSD